MQNEMSHLELFFEEFRRTLYEAIEGLISQQCEPNQAISLRYFLRDFETTLGLISSRLASLGSSDQFLEDIDELTRALCSLKASYLSRNNDEGVTEPGNEALFQLVESTGQTGRPRYNVDKDLVQRLHVERVLQVDGHRKNSKTLTLDFLAQVKTNCNSYNGLVMTQPIMVHDACTPNLRLKKELNYLL